MYKPVDPILGEVLDVVPVEVTTLKHFFDRFPWDRFPHIEYLKVDAQGADLDILKGAKQLEPVRPASDPTGTSGNVSCTVVQLRT